MTGLYKANMDQMKSSPMSEGFTPTAIKRRHSDVAISEADQEGANDCKKRNIGEFVFEDCGLPARLEVVVVNGKWDTSQTIPSIIAEMHSVNLDDLDGVNEFYVPWSENSVTEISLENDGSLYSQCAQEAVVVDSNLDSGIQSCSGESTPNCSKTNRDSLGDDGENNADDNLSWLINFKVDSIFNSANIDRDQGFQDGEKIMQGESRCRTSTPLMKATKSTGKSRFLAESNENNKKSQAPMKQHGKSFGRYSGVKKPPFTYTELIEQALNEKGQLTVSGIYQWISEHFPFYKANDDRWKNSVRHNLSINPYFRKGSKAPHGAGHLWAIANKDDNAQAQSANKRQMMRQFLSNAVTVEEVEAATASIEDNKENRNLHREVLLTIETQNNGEIEGSTNYTPSILSPQQCVSLEQSAEEILSGVKREVEVQYVIPVQEKRIKDTDFLNPVSKEVIAKESGLIDIDKDNGTSFVITDLNPAVLGLNMGDAEIITTDGLFGEEMGFHYYELTSPVTQQLQV